MDVKHCARNLMVFQASRFHHHIAVSVTWSFRWLLRRISWQFSTFVAAGGLVMTKTVGWCRSLASSALASILNLQSKKSTGCYWFVSFFLLLFSSALDRALSLSLFCSTRTQRRAQLNYQSIMLEVYQVHSFYFTQFSRNILDLIFKFASCVRGFSSLSM